MKCIPHSPRLPLGMGFAEDSSPSLSRRKRRGLRRRQPPLQLVRGKLALTSSSAGSGVEDGRAAQEQCNVRLPSARGFPHTAHPPVGTRVVLQGCVRLARVGVRVCDLARVCSAAGVRSHGRIHAPTRKRCLPPRCRRGRSRPMTRIRRETRRAGALRERCPVQRRPPCTGIARRRGYHFAGLRISPKSNGWCAPSFSLARARAPPREREYSSMSSVSFIGLAGMVFGRVLAQGRLLEGCTS
jgi:hypothetical protein